MTKKKLNNCLLLYIHKNIIENLNLREFAEEFVSLHEEGKGYFGTFHM